jgi:hypothetical protein
MKNQFKTAIVLVLTVFLSIVVKAQTTTKVLAVVNKADWCHVCQANGEKMMKEVMPVFENSGIRFIMNDLTNDATTEKSKDLLKENKVYDAVKKITYTGLVLLVDAETGKLTGKISVAEPAEKIIETLKMSAMKEPMKDNMMKEKM